jgi:trigger factor
MEITKKQVSKNKIKLTVEVPAEKMREFFEIEYNRLSANVTLPGFRPGKAPRIMMIESIGHTRISQGAIELAMNEGYKKALTDSKAMPVNQPNITVSQYPAFGDDLAKDSFAFDIEFDVISEAKIGDYKKFKLPKEDPKELEVSDEEADKVISYLARQAASLNVIDRVAQKGDWTEISFDGSIKGVVMEKLSSKNFPLVIGEANMVPGFEDEIVGLKKSDKKEFDITFPKTIADKELADKKVHFVLTIEEVKEVVLPKIDKEFSQKFGRSSVADLKKSIKDNLVEEKKENNFYKLQGLISDQVAKITKVDVPESLIEQEYQRMKSELEENLKKQGTTYEKYFESIKMDPKKAENDLRDQSRKNIVIGVGLGEIAKAEKITITAETGTTKIFERIIELARKN